MSADNFTGQNISDTFRRLLQLSDNGSYITDGTGSIVNILPVTASYVLNGGGTGTPGVPVNSIQYNAGGGNFGGSSNLTYTGGNLNVTGSIVMSGSSTVTGVKSIDFDIIQDPTLVTQQEGRLFWNNQTKTLQLDLEQNFHTDINQQLLVRVVNPYSFTLPIGTVVYITGSQGNRPTVATASWTGDQTSAATLGFTAKNINQNNNGYVITRGILDGVNTAGIPVGSQLYLSSSGQFTNQHVDAPLHEVRLGKVLVSDATVGSIYVDIMNGYELDELHDVKATNPAYGDLLMYSSSLWTASKILSGNYTLSGSLTTNDGVSVVNLSASFISASSITGSLFGTASWATNALTASSVLPLNQNVVITGSLTVITGSNIEFQVTNTGTKIGNVIGDVHSVTGSLNVTGSVTTAGTVGVNTTTTSDAIAGTDWLKVVAGATTFGLSTGNSGQGFISVTNGTVTGFGGHTNNTDGMVFGSTSNHGLALRTQNTNRLKIDNIGNISLLNVPTTAQTNVLTYNATTGLVCYTPTSSLGVAGVSQIIAGTNVTISPAGGTGVVTINATGGGSGSPGGSDTYVQYNSASTFQGNNGFTYNYSNKQVNVNKLVVNEWLQLKSISIVDDTNTPYVAAQTETVLFCNTVNAPVDIDLSQCQTNGQIVIIKDIGGNAGTNFITFTNNNIDGGNFTQMDHNYQAITMIFSQFAGFWCIIGRS